eukprot:6227006-Prymnesium_polylepis.3
MTVAFGRRFERRGAAYTRDRMRRSKRGPEARRRLDAVIAAGGASSVGVGSLPDMSAHARGIVGR